MTSWAWRSLKRDDLILLKVINHTRLRPCRRHHIYEPPRDFARMRKIVGVFARHGFGAHAGADGAGPEDVGFDLRRAELACVALDHRFECSFRRGIKAPER